MIILMRLCGFLFLFILVLNLVMGAFGKKIEVGDYDIDAKLQKFNEYPDKFKKSIVFGLLEHFSIITLAILLFIVFSPHNLILGFVWLPFRIGEGLIFIHNETKYRGLLNIARKYSVTSGAEKDALINSGRTILQTDKARYNVALILFSIGTLAYSIVFVTYGVIPPFIGWLGIVTGVSLGISSGIQVVKPNLEGLSIIGGLSAMLFEVCIGGWLLFFAQILP